ncbi:hypothetical protein LOTGIDRAFT_220559 [Lottia gigantea]|uniref:Sugar phosphate transporter domain-containing protein n=1 Tax=Lottia gigantea TaxID=225164 RepID=V3Z6T5_LOTGI|nr:hypothetical protein LOTGIDRAFT_220559 [Lottia gigantea]ESO86518.1 hypothetical protein LOTGIDRAFT_220559 [Lottia gigantea]
MKDKKLARHLIQDVVEPKARLIKKSVCSRSFITQLVKTGCLVLFYYFFSISLTFYNQRFIHSYKYPLSITMCHLIVKFVIAGIFRSLLQCYSHTPRATLNWTDYWKKIAPTGIASVLDIGFSNWSFEFVTVSLYTMCKSTAIIFILFFSILFKLEKFRCSLLFVVLFISGGLFMFTYHSTQFNLEGFFMVMLASFLSGVRWTLAQFILQKKELGLQNPVDMMYHIQPWMMLGLLPLSTIFEGLDISTTSRLFRYEDTSVLLTSIGLISLGAMLAFFLEFSEFLFLSHTSSLTLSISGIFKEICTLYLATQINGDKMNTVNVLGLLMCLCGITLHVILRAVSSKSTILAKICLVSACCHHLVSKLLHLHKICHCYTFSL